jgi:hypothetical protein
MQKKNARRRSRRRGKIQVSPVRKNLLAPVTVPAPGTKLKDGYMSTQKNYLLLVIIIAWSIVSCENKEIYEASITVINNSGSVINNFMLECEGEKNTIAELNPAEQKIFNVTWIGRSSFFAASIDNSYIFLKIEYYINGKKYDVSNEAGASQDDYGNYYSNKTITNDSKVTIEIKNNGYEIAE